MLHHVSVGDGKPVVFLHGSTLDHRHMKETFEPIFSGLEGWRRIYVDMPGHGQSPARDSIATQDDLLAAVMEFVETLLPGQRHAVAGESRGSYIAEGMVHLRPEPVAGVALIVPGGSPTADPARLPTHEVLQPDASLEDEMSEAERQRFGRFWVVQRRDILERSRHAKSPARALWDAGQAARIDDAFDFSFHARGETRPYDGPSLIVAGRQDCMSGYLDAIDLVPRFTRASLAVLDTAGHGVAWERPDMFAALVRDWLERVADRF